MENFSWGSWKVLDFFVSKRVGTLVYVSVSLSVCLYQNRPHKIINMPFWATFMDDSLILIELIATKSLVRSVSQWTVLQFLIFNKNNYGTLADLESAKLAAGPSQKGQFFH